MRRAIIILVALAGVARADEVADVPDLPPETYCFGPAPWDGVTKCLALHAPDAKLAAKPTLRTQLIRLGADALLYVRTSATNWRMLARFSGDPYEITNERALRLGKQGGVRIDLRQSSKLQVELGRFDVLTERIAFVCTDDGACTRLVFECTVMSRGRTSEIFRGDVAIDSDGRAHVDGDRSRSGPRCTGR